MSAFAPRPPAAACSGDSPNPPCTGDGADPSQAVQTASRVRSSAEGSTSVDALVTLDHDAGKAASPAGITGGQAADTDPAQATAIILAADRASADARPQPSLSRGLTLGFAIAAGIAVANVYYVQPVLDAIGAELGIGQAALGGLVGMTQLGSVLALLLLVPLGDVLPRRRLIVAQWLSLVLALLLVSFAHHPGLLLSGMLLLGLLGTASTQGMLAYAAAAAPPAQRGQILGVVQAGVVIGLLLARSVAGGLTSVAGWRAVYVLSALLVLLLPIWLGPRLPMLLPAASRPSYPALLRSMLDMLTRDRILRRRGALAFWMFAAFAAFWTALVLPLGAAPYHYGHATIGAFGLVGAIGALAASRAGKLADRGRARGGTRLALGLLLFSWLPLALLPWSLSALLLGVLLLDVGGQALHVLNQSLILRAPAERHGRLIASYMLFYAAGSGLGALGATLAYAYAAWPGVCALGAGCSLIALWLGWSGGSTDEDAVPARRR